MRSLRELDISNNEDFVFLGELFWQCKDRLTDETNKDIPKMVAWIEQQIGWGKAKALIGMINQKPVGVIIAWLDGDTALVTAGLLKENRNAGNAVRFLKLFLSVAFQKYGLYKVSFRIATDNRAAEKVCRFVGAKKEGLLREEEKRKEGRADLVLLSITKPQWVKGQHEKRF